MKWVKRGLVAGGVAIAASACGSSVTVDETGAGGATAAAGGVGGGATTGGFVASTSQGSGAGQATGVTTGQGAGSGVGTGPSTGVSTAVASSTGAGPSSSAVTSSTTTGAGGGPPSGPCSNCADAVAMGVCATQYNACMNDFACSYLVQCHGDCNWTTSCNSMCDNIIPSGVPLLMALMKCVVCDSCKAVCMDSAIYQAYCL